MPTPGSSWAQLHLSWTYHRHFPEMSCFEARSTVPIWRDIGRTCTWVEHQSACLPKLWLLPAGNIVGSLHWNPKKRKRNLAAQQCTMNNSLYKNISNRCNERTWRAPAKWWCECIGSHHMINHSLWLYYPLSAWLCYGLEETELPPAAAKPEFLSTTYRPDMALVWH